MELRQYANVLIKWWWLIAAAVVVASVSALFGSLATPKQYQSRTTLMVGQIFQNPNPNGSDFSTGQALAQSYSDLVRREPVLRETLKSLNLEWDWGTLQNMVSSHVVPGTQLIEIDVIDSNPMRSQILADQIVKQLIMQSPAGTDPQKEAERQFGLAQIEDIKKNLKNAQDEINQLDDVIAKANSSRQIQDARTRQDSLRQQISSWQATYAQLLTTLQQGTTNFLSVVEPAQLGFAVGTSTMTNVMLAAAIGLTLASAAAFLLEYLDDTIKSTDDVRQVTELETLGGVALIEGEDYASKLITILQPRSPTAEAYRMLRTNLQFSSVDRPLQTLLVTSANPVEGKSVTVANIAVAMAQAGKQVVLVDADLRRPVQHLVFNLDNNIGLTSILLDSNTRLENALQNTSVQNLKVMTSGPIPPNPSEMLGSKRMGYLIDALQKQADIVIFDSPPVMAVADATVLATRLDGTLLVIDSGHTRRAMARRSKEALSAVGATVLGAVLNHIPMRGTAYHYYYGEERERRRRIAVTNLFSRRNRHAAPTTPPAKTHAAATERQT